MQVTVRLIIIWGFIISSGCKTQPMIDPIVEITPSSFPPSNTPGDTQMPPSPPTPSQAGLQSLIDKAKKDLARRLSISTDEIVLLQAKSVSWPDASLDCPRPGQFYPTGRVPGFQIWLALERTEYIYNMDFNGTAILCPELNPSVPDSIIGPTTVIGPPIK